MTVIDTRIGTPAHTGLGRRIDRRPGVGASVARPGYRKAPVRRRPQNRRPAGAAMQHRGTGVLMSRASHRRRPISPAATVVLALLAGVVTIWLGLVAQLGGVVGATSAEVPSRLAVVQVETGESLTHVAQRVAPDAPVAQVVDRIRELNKLDTAGLQAGQTLIAPVG